MRPSEALRRAAAREWRANLAHPFVRAIGDGTLPRGRFVSFLRQDYLFLVEFSRVLALAAAKAPSLAEMTRFAELLRETLVTEMALHRRVCAREGVAAARLARTRPTPITGTYTAFLLRTAGSSDWPGLLAALLPCMWGYAEVGRTLRRRRLPGVARYDAWIRSYSDPAFVAAAAWLRRAYDRAGNASPRDRGLFREALRHELAFWEQALPTS